MLTGERDLGAARSALGGADVAQLGGGGRGQPPGQRFLVRRDQDLPDVPAGGGHQGGGDAAGWRGPMFGRRRPPHGRTPRPPPPDPQPRRPPAPPPLPPPEN